MRVEPTAGGPTPAIRLELQALGQTWTPPLAVDGEGLVARVTLPEAARLSRVRAWCGEQAQARICADLLWLPDDVEGDTLALALVEEEGGPGLRRVPSGPQVPLAAQVGLGSLLVLLVGLASLRRLGREA